MSRNCSASLIASAAIIIILISDFRLTFFLFYSITRVQFFLLCARDI